MLNLCSLQCPEWGGERGEHIAEPGRARAQVQRHTSIRTQPRRFLPYTLASLAVPHSQTRSRQRSCLLSILHAPKPAQIQAVQTCTPTAWPPAALTPQTVLCQHHRWVDSIATELLRVCVRHPNAPSSGIRSCCTSDRAQWLRVLRVSDAIERSCMACS